MMATDQERYSRKTINCYNTNKKFELIAHETRESL